MPSSQSSPIVAEQAAIDELYARRDQLIAKAEADLARVRREPTAGTPSARQEQAAFNAHYVDRIDELRAAEQRLCFGRLDMVDGGILRVGRLSLSDEEGNRPLLTDWRAQAAMPFYQATSVEPMGVIRRRHIVTSGRTVTSVEDDVLDLSRLEDLGETVEGGGALMAALAGPRTGRMGDIVATIQAEQDRIIRAPLQGIMVVEGGPGCGKTVVALHRAAFLLYTHRERIMRSGLLVVGPNPLFLQYIGHVLPALGETSAVLVSPGQLYPPVNTDVEDAPEVAMIKGGLGMAKVMQAAVRERQRPLRRSRRLSVHASSGGTVTIELRPEMVAEAIERARASRKPHNKARLTFVLTLLDLLSRELARVRRLDWEANRERLDADLRDSPDVRREVNLCWMPLTPEGVLRGLYADPDYLARCAPRMSPQARARLQRSPDQPWTISDVPLLDELAEMLGDEDEKARREEAEARKEQRIEEAYVAKAAGLGHRTVTATDLIEHYSGPARRSNLSERAGRDRSWEYGHIVVDEAQELSPMAWRVLMRRCPTRSMTVVGDLNQTGYIGGPTSWNQVFDRYTKERWRSERLTVNYRTPREITEFAEARAKEHGLQIQPGTNARHGDLPVERELAGLAELAELLEQQLTDPSIGRIAVVTRDDMRAEVEAELVARLGSRVGTGDEALDHPVSVLTARGVKGLEFDVVVVLDADGIRAQSRNGVRDLYVVMTRPTQRLIISRIA